MAVVVVELNAAQVVAAVADLVVVVADPVVVVVTLAKRAAAVSVAKPLSGF